LLEIAEAKDFDDITIGEITERAGINRKTFYLHYRDKHALLDEALDSLLRELTEASRRLVDTHGPLDPNTPPPTMRWLLEHLAARPALYRRLFGPNGVSHFAMRLQSLYYAGFLKLWNDLGYAAPPGAPPVEFRATFASAATQRIAAWWLLSESQESPDAVAAWMWQLMQPLWFDLGAVTTGGKSG
jgi:AcrR family transcriptional regulator